MCVQPNFAGKITRDCQQNLSRRPVLCRQDDTRPACLITSSRLITNNEHCCILYFSRDACVLYDREEIYYLDMSHTCSRSFRGNTAPICPKLLAPPVDARVPKLSSVRFPNSPPSPGSLPVGPGVFIVDSAARPVAPSSTGILSRFDHLQSLCPLPRFVDTHTTSPIFPTTMYGFFYAHATIDLLVISLSGCAEGYCILALPARERCF